MTKGLGRRLAVAGILAAPALSARAGGPTLPEQFAALERAQGGRLGVAVLDTAGGAPVAWRGRERFAQCSTFKALAAANVLARVDHGQDRLDRRIAYTTADLLPYAPTTSLHVATGMSLGALCAAAVTLSDNTAANLVLRSFGGPAALTRYVRGLGDDTTRFDRTEPTLNDVAPGDPRDTTTPLAMLATLRRLVLGDALSTASRRQLRAWLVADETGGRRLRAGVPPGWTVGDKTGTGIRNETNDIAVLWPPGRAPLVVTAYYTGSAAPMAAREAVLAAVGRLVAEAA